jgi:hypothetical protein
MFLCASSAICIMSSLLLFDEAEDINWRKRHTKESNHPYLCLYDGILNY